MPTKWTMPCLIVIPLVLQFIQVELIMSNQHPIVMEIDLTSLIENGLEQELLHDKT